MYQKVSSGLFVSQNLRRWSQRRVKNSHRRVRHKFDGLLPSLTLQAEPMQTRWDA